MKDDDIYLLAQLDNLTNNITAPSSTFPLTPEIKVMDSLQGLQTTSNGVLQDHQFETNKLPILSKSEAFGYSTSHYVRYKLQDGKHIKIWECGICKYLIRYFLF